MFLAHLSHSCAGLIRHLLQLDVERRLGCGPAGTRELLVHPWFVSMDFDRLYRQDYVAPFIPIPISVNDASHRSTSFLRFYGHECFEKEFADF
jgi:hypothetical protein